MDILLLGFGAVGRAFCELLEERSSSLRKVLPKGEEIRVVGIGTRTRGCLYKSNGLPLSAVLDWESKTGKLFGLEGVSCPNDSESLVEQGDYDLLVECTTSSLYSSAPIARAIKKALDRGKAVVTCNSTMVYRHYFELKELAECKGGAFLFDSAVVAGTPIFSYVRHFLPAVKVSACYGVLNGTANYVLEMMEDGATLDEAVMEAVRKGFAEKDPLLDIEGTDSAIKASIIAQALMDAPFQALDDMIIEGIRNVTPDMLRKAKKEGGRVKLVANIRRGSSSVEISVKPEIIPSENPVSKLRGASKGVIITTDLAGEVYLASDGFGPRQMAYGLLRDSIEAGSQKMGPCN